MFGFAGGAVGTYCSVKNTRGPIERRFMIKAAAVTWIAGLIFLGLLLGLPTPYRFFIWIPYGILMPLGIRYTNKRIQEIRSKEAV